MSFQDRLTSIRTAKSGMRAIVVKQFETVSLDKGEAITLPVDTSVEIIGTNGDSLSAVAQVYGARVRIKLFDRDYPMLA